jgi:hypothetical protein
VAFPLHSKLETADAALEVRAMPISRLCSAASLVAIVPTVPAIAGEDVGAGQ